MRLSGVRSVEMRERTGRPVGRRVRPWAGPLAVVGAAAAVAGLVEALHWWASRREWTRPAGARRGGAVGAQAVIVLGYPASRGGRTHPVQRWRTDIAVRSMGPGPDSRLVFTGGGPPGHSEAEVMGAYAREVHQVPADWIVLETRARNTWQNIAFTLPFVEDADTIAVASDPLHAARARRYLRAQRPDLAARLVPARDYRLLEHWWLKAGTAAYEVARGLHRRWTGRARILRSERFSR